jgi:RND superfamily putative drug exporter
VAWVSVRLRWLVVLGWVGALVAATLYLPSLTEAGSAPLGGLVPRGADAVRAAERSAELFPVPIRSGIAIVERDEGGLSQDAQARVAERAAEVVQAEGAHPSGAIFAIPLVNDRRLIPSAREQSTTAITWLFFDPELGLRDQTERARELALAGGENDAFVGVTGAIPARLAEFDEIEDALPWVELATVILIAVLLAFTFRSVGAPLLALAAAAVAYGVSIRVVSWVGEAMEVGIPQEVEPLMVVLLLGIVTDYAIFFLAGVRRRLEAGETHQEAVVRASGEVIPIVFTAGLIVACGSAALLVGKLEFFRAFGPGLALSALIGLGVSITLIPALMAIFGRAIFWPGLRAPITAPAEPAPEDEAAPVAEALPEPPAQRSRRYRIARVATARPVAAAITLVVVGALVAAGLGLRDTNLGFTLIRGLPENSEERQADLAASRGFEDGIVSPTEVLVEGSGLAPQLDALVRLEELIGQQEGVAAILGPREAPDRIREGAVLSENGNAARYAVVWDEPAVGGNAIDDLEALEVALPGLVEEAGLDGATTALAGDTALAAETVASTVGDIWRIGLVALAVNLVLLALFLRSIVAPLVLLVTSVLALAATLGIATYVFQDFLGYEELTYYVPFAAAVLLVSLGSDYNVFVAGQISSEARRRPLREAVAVAAPRASRAISIAGIALALSFAILALVPLRVFRELAFVLALGVVLDAFLVRSLLVPALISLIGRLAWWPRKLPRFRRRRGLSTGRTIVEQPPATEQPPVG